MRDAYQQTESEEDRERERERKRARERTSAVTTNHLFAHNDGPSLDVTTLRKLSLTCGGLECVHPHIEQLDLLRASVGPPASE